MNIPENVRKHLEKTVSEAFPDERVTDIRVEDVTVDVDAGEIRITLIVSTTVDPTKFAEGYFGLTGKIRRSLAENDAKWGRFFPVITPSIGQEVHA